MLKSLKYLAPRNKNIATKVAFHKPSTKFALHYWLAVFFTDIQVVNIVFVSCPVGRVCPVNLFDIREEGKWSFVLISLRLKYIVGPEDDEN